MTEREIPAGMGSHFDGQTNGITSTFAPSAVSEPDLPGFSASEAMDSADSAPVYRSRREMRAAGAYARTLVNQTPATTVAVTAPDMMTPAPDAAAPATPIPLVEPAAPAVRPEPEFDSIAALFPLLAEVPVPAAEASTQAMELAELEAELSAPVAPYLVPQSAPIMVVPPVPTPDRSIAQEAARLDVAAIFGIAASEDGDAIAPADVTAPAGSRRALRAAPAEVPSDRQPKRKRAKRDRPMRRAVPAKAESRKSIRQRLTGAGVMVLVGGLFAVLALPAYADNDASALTGAATIRTQKLTVSDAAASTTTATVSRDGYTATSAADLKSLYASAIRQQNLNAYLQSGAKAQGDDYPWYAELSRNQGGSLSPLNYYYRECVDFVAWRLNRDAGDTTAPFTWTWSTLTPNGGNASQWKSAWLAHGWPTGTTPQVGAVAWFTYNHVGYVSGILNDGSVLIEEYNWEGNHLYSTRVIAPGDAYYLYAPPA